MLLYLIQSDTVLTGVLLAILALVFYTSSSSHPGFKKFYSVIPMLLLCYFIPSLLTTFKIVDVSQSNVYYVASRYLLPASLILLTLSIDLKEIIRLGPKALIMFFTATVGVIAGGPLAILIVSLVRPDVVGGLGPEAVWKGMSTIAGSWIGGGANQAAMYEIFEPSDALYSISITIDVIVAEIWMAFLLFGIGKRDKLDRFFKADGSAIKKLEKKMENFSLSIRKIPSTTDLMVILGIGLGGTALAHAMADWLAPFFK